MKKILIIIGLNFMALMVIPILYYSIFDLIDAWNRAHVKDDFYIEYLESSASISLWNGKQSFVRNVSKTYWNEDSLVVSGEQGYFLIEFRKTKYNDEMVEINWSGLSKFIKNEPISSYNN